MLAVNFSSIRESLKKYCDKVYQDSEAIIITRRNDENVVMISEREYNNLIENMYIRQSPANYKKILESVEQFKTGRTKKVEELYD